MSSPIIKSVQEITAQIDSAVKLNQPFKVYDLCGVLADQLNRLDIEAIDADALTEFLKAKSYVNKWAKSVLRADCSCWYEMKQAIESACISYKPKDKGKSCEIFAALCGREFVDYFGIDFCDKLAMVLRGDTDIVEEKKSIIASLWRFYEIHRKEMQRYSNDANKIIGIVANKMSVRHESEHQETQKFLSEHSQLEYNALLKGTIETMLTLFAYHRITSSTVPALLSRL